MGLAALLDRPDRWRGRRVALVLSGGNIDVRMLASVLMRELVHSGRISTLRISLPDLPGQLAPVLAIVAGTGANVIEIEHRRLFDPISPEQAKVRDGVIRAFAQMYRPQPIHGARTGPLAGSKFSSGFPPICSAMSHLTAKPLSYAKGSGLSGLVA